MQPTAMGSVFAGAGLLAVPFAWLTWWHSDEAGGRPLVVVFLSLSAHLITYAFELGTVDVDWKFVWLRLSLIFLNIAFVAWVFVALEISGRDRWVDRVSVVLMAGIPVAFGAVLFAPRFAPALTPWTQSVVATLPTGPVLGPLRGTAYEPGPPLIALSLVGLVLLLFASAIFLQLVVRSRHLYRLQALAVTVAAVAPWLNLYIDSVGVLPRYDLRGLLFLAGGAALTVSLVRPGALNPASAGHESVFKRMGNGVIILDPSGLIYDLNRSARSMLGLAEEATLQGTHVADCFDEWDAVTTSAETESSWQQLAIDRGNKRRYLEVRLAPFTDHRDNTIGQLVELRDVTERESRERALDRFQTVFTTVEEPVYVLDDDGRFELVNHSFAELTGYSYDELDGEPFGTVRVEDDGVPDPQSPVELTFETSSGDRLPVETMLTPIETRFEGLAGGAVGFARDISERKRVEAALSRATERYETLVGASPIAILALDTEWRVESWNPAAEEMFGWTTDEVLEEGIPIIPDDERPRIVQVTSRVLEGERLTNTEFVLQRASGERFDASVSMAPTYDGDEIDGAVAVIADVSEQKARERALERQNERLDEFAEVVSHDLRNPLNIADGYVQMASETGDTAHLDGVTEAHERMERIIDDVLSLARNGSDIEDPETLSLSGVVDDAWSMTPAESVQLELEGELGTVEGDPSRLRQLFENLFRNTDDHCPDGTTITVGPLGNRDGFFVADDGPGIPPEERDEVFDSGYTTAEEGTGLGLSTVQTIADAHEWSVRVTESADGGARFEFETGPFGERHDAGAKASEPLAE